MYSILSLCIRQICNTQKTSNKSSYMPIFATTSLFWEVWKKVDLIMVTMVLYGSKLNSYNAKFNRNSLFSNMKVASNPTSPSPILGPTLILRTSCKESVKTCYNTGLQISLMSAHTSCFMKCCALHSDKIMTTQTYNDSIPSARTVLTVAKHV